MKIKITDLPKYQFKGLVGEEDPFDPSKIPDYSMASAIGKRNSFGQWTSQYDTPKIVKDFVSSQYGKGRGVLGVGAEQPKSNVQAKKSTSIYGPAVASAIAGYLSKLGDIMEGNQTTNELLKARREQGQTDAAFPSMHNAYSRGRTENGFAWNMMTPVQFAGTPVYEYYGSPKPFAQEGLSVTRDLLGLPDLYSNPTDFDNVRYKDVALPEAPMVRPRASFAPAPVPTSSSIKDVQILTGDEMDPDAVLETLAASEGGSTGQRTKLVGPQGQRATASGKWQITENTRNGIYNAHFKDIMSKNDFEKKYASDPNFERIVAKTHVMDLLPKYGSLVFGAWYYPSYADQFMKGDVSVLNKIPRKDYGNKISWGDYVKQAQNKYFNLTARKFKEGGEYELNNKEIDYILANGGQVEYL